MFFIIIVLIYLGLIYRNMAYLNVKNNLSEEAHIIVNDDDYLVTKRKSIP